MFLRSVVAGMVVVAGAAFSQPLGLTESRPGSIKPPTLNAPYSLEELHVSIYPSGNGSAPKEIRTTTKAFRDSQGRVRTERIAPPGAEGENRLLVTLTDGPHGRACFLNSDDKVAHCFSGLAIKAGAAPTFVPAEDLGSRTIAGVRAEGKRGKDGTRPAEQWTSPDLHLVLQSTTGADGSLQTKTAITMLRVGEPDASLFEIPADFKIVEETGDRAVIFEGAPIVGALRPGNGVSQPKPIRKVAPSYTEEARRDKITGTVGLTMVVGADGRATNIRVTRSLDPGLDQQAIKALREWVFEPGQKDGKAVPVLAAIEMNFRLQ